MKLTYLPVACVALAWQPQGIHGRASRTQLHAAALVDRFPGYRYYLDALRSNAQHCSRQPLLLSATSATSASCPGSVGGLRQVSCRASLPLREPRIWELVLRCPAR